MITAKFAGEQGRLLFAVPGRIDQATSAGCHQLIRDGATLLTNVDDILDELNYLDGLGPRPIPAKGGTDGGETTDASAGAGGARAGELSETEQKILACFAGGAMVTLDELAGLTGLPMAELSPTLMMLELRRVVVKRADGTFEARG